MGLEVVTTSELGGQYVITITLLGAFGNIATKVAISSLRDGLNLLEAAAAEARKDKLEHSKDPNTSLPGDTLAPYDYLL